LSVEPEIHIHGDRARFSQGRAPLGVVPLEALVKAIQGAGERGPSCGVLPKGVRIWRERGDVVGVAVEIPPHARSVRWLAEDSKAPFGPGARYREVYLGFPYLVLLLVLRQGQLTGLQQLYYRRAPLDRGDELLLPNLYNVAAGHGQRCWLCLQHVGDVGPLRWPERIARVVDHLFSAAFNQSSERNEGNSYWGSRPAVDPRVASLEAWQSAARANPLFALEVPWEPAGTTATAELAAMLDRVLARKGPPSAAELWTLVAGGRRGQKRP
jgi:hypothetical protein